MGKKWKQWQILFSWAPESLWTVTVSMKVRDAPWKKSHDKPRQRIKKQGHYLAYKGLSSQSYGFSRSHVWMWELEGWVPKDWCFQTVVLEKTRESPVDRKEIKAVNPKGNEPWISIGGTDGEAEAPVLWPRDAKSQLIGKDLMLGKIEGRKRRGRQRMRRLYGITWIHRHEFEQTPGDSEGKESLACCSSWGHKELDTTQQLNNNKNKNYSSEKQNNPEFTEFRVQRGLL